MKELRFRALYPQEIEVRASRCTAKGAIFLLYKDARCDMRILDETVGAMKWQRRHEEHNGNLFCSVGIYDEETREWVWKEDAGSESASEAEKGHASDSFKRACVNWGIGRELYSKILIYVKGITRDSGRKDGKGRAIYELSDPYMKLHVKEIETEEVGKRIRRLVIVDEKGVEAFRWEDKG